MSSPPPSSPLPPSPSLSSPHSYNLSLLVIFSLLAIVAVVTTSLRLLLRSRGPTTASAATSTSTTTPSNATLVATSLPLFALSALPPRGSPVDCAVCLSAFRPDETLRALPACRHAFHAACVDRWIGSTPSSPSCPLCRAPIDNRPAEANVHTSTSWLKEYVDRTVGSTATSTPFSSARVSGDQSVSLDVGEESFGSSESGGYFASSYNWMAGAVP